MSPIDIDVLADHDRNE